MSVDRDTLLSERILQSMRDGVIAIDLSGTIIMFNEAAGTILGRDPKDVLGQPFGQEFMLDERFDDFNELVLSAVYDAQVVHSTEVVIRDGEMRTDLAMSSSFLTHVDEKGEEQRFGVVAVFSDVTEQRKRRKLKRLFGEYVDPRIVDQILSRGDDTESRRADMTISFVDMRDFTGWSERLPAQELTDLLNQFLAAVTRPIGEQGGITDKYIGDAAMACWGPPFTNPDTQAAGQQLGQQEALAQRQPPPPGGELGADDGLVSLCQQVIAEHHGLCLHLLAGRHEAEDEVLRLWGLRSTKRSSLLLRLGSLGTTVRPTRRTRGARLLGVDRSRRAASASEEKQGQATGEEATRSH